MAFAPRSSYAASKTSLGGGWAAGGVATKASLTTALTGTNNDLTYTSKSAASNLAGGNSTRIRYVVAGASTPLTVSVSGSDITVNVATNGSSVATSTAAQVAAAIAVSAPASALVSVANAPGDDGTGVVTALAFTSLAGGQDYVIGRSR